jgi:hypothetical protein
MIEIVLKSDEGQRYILTCRTLDDVDETIRDWTLRYPDYQYYGYKLEEVREMNKGKW